MEGKLTSSQTRALDALLDGLTIQDAAAVAGVNRKTVSRWLEQPDFWRAYTQRSGQTLQLAARRLTGRIDSALSVLDAVLADDEAPAGVRLRAAQLTIDSALRLVDAADFADRLAALEARLDTP